MGINPIVDFLQIGKAAPKRPSSNNNVLGTLVMLLAIGAACYLAYERFGQREDRQDDREEQVDPQPSGKVAAVILIHERENIPAEHIVLQRAMPEIAKQFSVEYRVLDDDLPEAASYLAYGLTKGVQSPMVVMQDDKRKPIAAYEWPTKEKLERYLR